jgi:hypothetical protein
LLKAQLHGRKQKQTRKGTKNFLFQQNFNRNQDLKTKRENLKEEHCLLDEEERAIDLIDEET